MNKYEVIKVTERNVVCSDDHSPDNHPTVYYTIGYNEDFVVCGYCNQKFVYNDINKGNINKEKLK
jgi:uncharacterized Zn-finger protein